MFLHCLHDMLRNSSIVISDVMKLVKIRQMGILTSTGTQVVLSVMKA